MSVSRIKSDKVDKYILRSHVALYELTGVKTCPMSHASKPLLEEAMLHMGIHSPFTQIYDLMFAAIRYFRCG